MRPSSRSKQSLPKQAGPAFASVAALQRTLVRWLSDESGAAAVEYSLLLAFISLAILTAIESLSGAISGVATRLATAIASG